MNVNEIVEVKQKKKSYGHTGPKSIAGKNRSRWNALNDGATAKSSVLPFENERLYKKHIKEVEEALAPRNYVEVHLVREYAEGLWRIARHENRSAFAREKILEGITPEMVAGMLNLGDSYVANAPNYLTNLKYKISAKEGESAKHCLQLYRHLQDNAKGIGNFNMVWAQYKILYEALDVWLTARGGKTTPILNNLRTGLNLAWQQHPKTFLDLMTKFSYHLFFVAHFESFKPEIRVWMEAWYFAQKAHMRNADFDEQLLLKERNHAHGLLEKIARLRKSELFSENLPGRIRFDQSGAQDAYSENEMTKNTDKS
jgi:hypothetical protein